MVDFNSINRWRFTREFFEKLRKDHDKGFVFNPFLKKYKPTFKGIRPYIDGRPIFMENEVEKQIKHIVLKTGAPLGVESLHNWIGNNWGYGISRRDISKVLRADKQFSENEKRGDRPTGVKRPDEGTRRFLFSCMA